MHPSKLAASLFFVLVVLIPIGWVSCSSGEDPVPVDPISCSDMCLTGGFLSWSETDFGTGIYECVCTNGGTRIEQEACTAYCATYDIGAKRAKLGKENVANDKCTCDGRD